MGKPIGHNTPVEMQWLQRGTEISHIMSMAGEWTRPMVYANQLPIDMTPLLSATLHSS